MSGAEVIISENTKNGDRVLYRYVTDENGQTPPSPLDAPDRANSLSSDSPGPDFSLYTVTVVSEGFYSLVSLDVPVFSGIVSRQDMVLIPLTASSAAGTDEFTPDCPPYCGGFGAVCDKAVKNG